MPEISLVYKMRERIKIEDELLNSRTTIFLGINGLWAAAAGISSETALQIGIGVLGVTVTALWLICSWQSWQVIKSLTREYRTLQHNLIDEDEKRIEEVVQRALLRTQSRLRPTNILALWLPLLFLTVWGAYLLWVVGSNLA